MSLPSTVRVGSISQVDHAGADEAAATSAVNAVPDAAARESGVVADAECASVHGTHMASFLVEEIKSKRKAKGGPKFKVEFFAVDGEDFDRSHHYRMPPVMAAARQESESRTPMSLEALMDWHMPTEANMEELNCKLFQRISIGLSRTSATAVVRPRQVLHLRDGLRRDVMNDGVR